MFFNKPELATRHPNQLTGELRDVVFQPDNKEEIFYTAAYAYYRMKLHLGNRRIPRGYQKVKWYLLMALKYKLCGGQVPPTNSRKILEPCRIINEFVSRNDQAGMEIWNGLCRIFDPVESLTRDRLKGTRYVAEVRNEVLGAQRGG